MLYLSKNYYAVSYSKIYFSLLESTSISYVWQKIKEPNLKLILSKLSILFVMGETEKNYWERGKLGQINKEQRTQIN